MPINLSDLQFQYHETLIKSSQKCCVEICDILIDSVNIANQKIAQISTIKDKIQLRQIILFAKHLQHKVENTLNK